MVRLVDVLVRHGTAMVNVTSVQVRVGLAKLVLGGPRPLLIDRRYLGHDLTVSIVVA